MPPPHSPVALLLLLLAAGGARASDYCAEPAGTCIHAGATHTFKMCDDASGGVQEGWWCADSAGHTGFSACDAIASHAAWAWPAGVCSGGATMAFVAVDPTAPIGQCEEDCETAADCTGDLMCFQRAEATSSLPSRRRTCR